MLTIELRPQIAEQLRQEAAHRHISPEELANDWLENQLEEEWDRKIHEEAERFRERHSEIYAKYAGEYIAMRDGTILDHDGELITLHDRVRAKYGEVPILMTPVTEEPIQTFNVLSNRID